MPHPIALEEQMSSLSVSSEVPATKVDGIKTNFEVEPSRAVLVTPTKSVASSVDDVESSFEDEASQGDEASTTVVKLLSKTEHKLKEEQGLVDEPLLKENPHRFVIFPIQDNDVS